MSTKYPITGCSLPFFWFAATELAALAYMIFPNWRFRQRLPLGKDASKEQQMYARYAEMGGTTQALVDFDLMEFLKSKEKQTPFLAALDLQSYDGNEIETIVGTVTMIYFDSGRLPRLYVTVNDEGQGDIWGPLIMAIAPVRDGTPHSKEVMSTVTDEQPPRSSSNFLRILEQYGVPKVA